MTLQVIILLVSIVVVAMVMAEMSGYILSHYKTPFADLMVLVIFVFMLFLLYGIGRALFTL